MVNMALGIAHMKQDMWDDFHAIRTGGTDDSMIFYGCFEILIILICLNFHGYPLVI
jgi:hypothetical protein